MSVLGRIVMVDGQALTNGVYAVREIIRGSTTEIGYVVTGERDEQRIEGPVYSRLLVAREAWRRLCAGRPVLPPLPRDLAAGASTTRGGRAGG